MSTLRATPEPVAIIGLGGLFPQAKNLHQFWDNILAGLDTISEVPESHWKHTDYFRDDPSVPDHTYGKRGGFLPHVDFPPLEFGITPNALEATDTTQLLGLLVARQALEDAGYGANRQFDRNRTSVILGVTGTLPLVIPLGARLGHPIWRQALKNAGVPGNVAEQVVEEIAAGYVGWQEDSFPGLLGNVVAGRIANRLNLGGTNCVVDAACASSLSALHLAMLELQSGRCDMALTGGMDTFNDIFMFMCFSKTPALSRSGDAKPFDANADGTILGEGLGCVVLKRLVDAERDGDTIYALIRSIGTSSDGKGHAIYAPSPAGQVKALRNAYELADVSPATIELVEAHGTGTKAGDTAEITALTEVYRETQADGTWCAIGSVKSQIGHTKAAAGAAGLLKATLALHHKVLPPTIKVSQPIELLNGGKSPFYITTEKRPWLRQMEHPRRAALSSFGFGGSNYHCVLEEYQREKADIDWDGQVQIVAFSAPSVQELRQKVDAWFQTFEVSKTSEVWDAIRPAAAATRREFRSTDAHRLVVVLQNGQDLSKLREQIAAQWNRNEGEFWSLPDGVYYASANAPGKIAMLFPGQGSQYVAMLRDLACQFPQMLQALIDGNTRFGINASERLSDIIYPFSAFSDQEKQRQETNLRSTNIAQPAIGAVSLGLLRILQHFGISMDAVAGHSFGELTALCAAGRITAEDFLQLAVVRGQLMATCSQGSMLALQMSADQAEDLLRQENLSLVVANRNAPLQTVISGSNQEIERACSVLSAKGISHRPLPVAAAFHSSLVAGVAQPFRQALEDIVFSPGRIPVHANSTGRPYPNDNEKCRTLLAEQLAKPVRFMEVIENMYADGVRTFVEVGPGTVLGGLVRSILQGKPVHVMSLDQSRGKQPGQFDLARALGLLAALGYPVALSRWEDGVPEPVPAAKKPALTVPICGANYRKPSPKESVNRTSHVDAEKPSPDVGGKQLSNGHTPTMPAGAPPISLPVEERKPDSPRLPDVPSPAKKATPMNVGKSVNKPNPMMDQTIEALQKIAEQTSELHRQFLEGQDRALQVLQTLVQQGTVTAENGTLPSAQAPKPPPAPVAAVPLAPSLPAKADVSRTSTPPQTSTEPTGSEKSPIASDSGNESPRRDEATHVLLEVVAEKTGYPAEMLNLDMEMDADLGIDSIKRVEIFSALQEKLADAPAVQSEHLGNLRTLRDVAEFLQRTPAQPIAPSSVAVSHEASTAPTGNVQNTDATAKILLEIIAEKTGYPADMLEPHMEMDADLGIDSIKRVEIFSAVQERMPAAPQVQSEHLGDLRTIGDVIGFLQQNVHTMPPAITDPVESVPASVHAADPVNPPNSETLSTLLLQVVADKTGYPPEMLDLDMEMDADLGIDSIKRVEIFSAFQERSPELPAIQSEQLGMLRTLRDVINFLGESPASESIPANGKIERNGKAEENGHQESQSNGYSPPVMDHTLQRYVLSVCPLDAERNRKKREAAPGAEFLIVSQQTELAGRIAERLNLLGHKARIATVTELLHGDCVDKIGGMVLLPPAAGTTDADLLQAFILLQKLSPALRESSKDSILMSVSRLDGCFGLQQSQALADPHSGGLAGLVKAARWEWPEVHCKALDVSPLLDNEEAALAIVSELFLGGPVEVGISPEGQCQLQLVESTQEPAAHLPLERGDVVLVTGGARGVTAEVSFALARSCAPTLILLGRSPFPEEEPDWLEALEGDAAIKQGLAQHAAGATSPREIAEQYRRIMASREIRRNLERLEQTGSLVQYRQVDVRDFKAVDRICEEIRDQYGPITGLIHGAGVLADRRIEDKTEEQFRLVYDTKVVGLRNFLSALSSDPLNVIALFSSSSGRFGRAGQVDYSIANEVLNKLAQAEARRRPDCRVSAINWGPWDGGMVTPGLQKLFASEGLDLIPLQEGANFFVQEIAQINSSVEVVVLGNGSRLPESVDSGQWIVDSEQESATTQARRLAVGLESGVRSEESQTTVHCPLTTAFSKLVSLEQFPALQSHIIGSKAVVPVVFLMEWFAQGALHDNPGLVFHGLDDLRVFRGIKLNEDDVYPVEIRTGKARKEAGMFFVPVELHGKSDTGEWVRHAGATVVLATHLPPAPAASPEPVVKTGDFLNREIYPQYLFHGPHFQGIEEVEGVSPEGIIGIARPAPAPREWVRQPMRPYWIADPLIVDCSFQLLVLWTRQQFGRPSLPSFLQQYRQYCRSFPREPMRIVATVTHQAGQQVTADIEYRSVNGTLIARLNGYQCIMDQSLQESFRRNRFEPVVIPAR